MSEQTAATQAHGRTTMDAGDEDNGRLSGVAYNAAGQNPAPEETTGNAGDLHLALEALSPASLLPAAAAKADTPDTTGWNEATERQTVQAGSESAQGAVHRQPQHDGNADCADAEPGRPRPVHRFDRHPVFRPHA